MAITIAMAKQMLEAKEITQAGYDKMVGEIAKQATPIRVGVGDKGTLCFYGVQSSTWPLSLYLAQLTRFLGIEVDISSGKDLRARLAKAIKDHDYATDTMSPLGMGLMLAEQSYKIVSTGKDWEIPSDVRGTKTDKDGKEYPVVIESARQASVIKPIITS